MRAGLRVACAAGLAAAALPLAACGSGPGPAGGSVLSASWGDPQSPLEPADTNEVQGGKVLDMVFRGLKRYDPRTGKAENMLAERIAASDARTYTVTVKDGWRFSDGEPVTARSFVDAWNYGASLRDHQKNAYFFGYIEGYDQVHPDTGAQRADTLSGLRVTGPRTFTVRLNQKFSGFPDTLGYAAFAPLPRTFFTHHRAWLDKPVGDGPYTIASYTQGAQMYLKKWDGYPGPDKARNDGVTLMVYTDADTAYTDVLAGNLDLVDDIPAGQLKNVRSDLAGRYIDTPAGILQTLAFPYYDPAWRSAGARKVRTGLSMAVDRAQITRTLFRGTRTPATDWTSPVLGADGGYRAGLCGHACAWDPAGARKLIREGGGLPGGQVRIAYNADSGSHKEWVDAVCHSIDNALGDDRACVGSPVGTFADFRDQISRSRMTGPFRAGWQMDYPLIQNFLQPLYYTGASSNDGRWSDQRFDRLVDQANAETGRRRAIGLFQQAEGVVRDEMAAIPLWYQNGSAGYSDRLHHVALNPFSVPVYDEITVG
ncbi:ABC transporter substrate-binding protein [Streptomyces sp. NPDC046985]|uniref:peptide ABC transporter substrate-binding protein n=1 Tax=Streptomyces sp. NPDC046985 TaxID=3155377 RepID=UPI0033FBEDF8